jgi:hypothetical protein
MATVRMRADAVSEDVPSYFGDRGAVGDRHWFEKYRDRANGMGIAFEAGHATAAPGGPTAPSEGLYLVEVVYAPMRA